MEGFPAGCGQLREQVHEDVNSSLSLKDTAVNCTSEFPVFLFSISTLSCGAVSLSQGAQSLSVLQHDLGWCYFGLPSCLPCTLGLSL